MIASALRTTPLTRLDHQRRTGTLGELDTAEDRLAVAEAIWSGQEQLHWNSVYWFEEQLRRLIDRVKSPHADALLRCVDELSRHLEQIDLLETEARAEVRGAREHLGNVRPSLQIDQHLADLFRLASAGLDEASLPTPMPEVA